jgi:hypothetical protein
MNTWAPSVNTLYRNAEMIGAGRVPRSISLRLGLSWGFGLPKDGRRGLTEYSFPLRSASDAPDALGLPQLLRQRGGVDIRRQADPHGDAMYGYLQAASDPVVAVVDSFYLPYRPAYGRVHSSRTVLVAKLEGSIVYVDDCWEPAYRGPLAIRHLDAARRSPAAASQLLEPIFFGIQGEAEWFTVSVAPLPLDDPARWAIAMVGALAAEIETQRQSPGMSFGLAAMRELVEMLAGQPEVVWEMIPRRTLALVLRAELSSRRYLCTFLRNAGKLAGSPALITAADRYQEGLRHFQAARDVLVKTLRHDRDVYDEFILARCRDALANEEQLATSIAAAGLSAPAVPEVALWHG